MQPISSDAGMRSNDSRVVVVLCTYNEMDNLPKVLAQLHLASPEFDVLVVDDNSPDGTGKWAIEQSKANPKLFVLSRPEKLGLGAALRDAFSWCLDRPYDFIINLDADLSHDPSQVTNLFKHCQSSQCDLVIGSRYVRGGRIEGLSLLRILASRMINAYARWMLKLQVQDCSGSFRCYRATKLRELDLSRLECLGYGFLQEVLVRLIAKGAQVQEVPICYYVRHGGTSKMRVADAVGALGVIHRLRRPQK